MNNSERIMLLIHLQLRLSFLVCERLLPFKQTKTLCLAVFDIRRQQFLLLRSDGILLYFEIQLREVFRFSGRRKDITQLNVVRRISSISATLFAEIKVPSSKTSSSTKMESKYLKYLTSGQEVVFQKVGKITQIFMSRGVCR